MSADLVAEWSFIAGGLFAVVAAGLGRQPCFAGFSVILFCLAADEGLDIHEGIGRWAERRGVQLPLLQDFDAVVLGAYGSVLIAAIVVWWGALNSSRTASRLLVSAVVAGSVAVAMDAFVPHGMAGSHAEEYFEAGAGMLLAAAFGVHAWHAVVRLTPDRWASRHPLAASFPLLPADDIPPMLHDVSDGDVLDHVAQRTSYSAR